MGLNYKYNPKIKPFYATINELGIGEYLRSKSFKLYLTKCNLDEFWNKCEKIRGNSDSSNVSFIGFDDIHVQHAEETFHIFLNEIHNKNKKAFFEIIRIIVIGFFSMA